MAELQIQRIISAKRPVKHPNEVDYIPKTPIINPINVVATFLALTKYTCPHGHEFVVHIELMTVWACVFC